MYSWLLLWAISFISMNFLFHNGYFISPLDDNIIALFRSYTFFVMVVLFFLISFYSNLIIENFAGWLAMKNKQLDDQLEMARIVQQNLIHQAAPEIDGVEFYSLYKPMDKIGGDLYDFIRFNEKNRIGIFLSDVSGHGVHAALITSMIKTLIETSKHEKLSTIEFLKYLNKKSQGLISGNFFTAFYAIFDNEKRTFRFSRGGHNFPYLVRNGEIIELKSKGSILGLVDHVSIDEQKITLQSGDKILMYTDGLTETLNDQGEEFESKLLSEVILKYVHLDIKGFVENIFNELVEFSKRDSFDDDVCIVGMEVCEKK
ncbi:MAG: serine/threonine-protein phosphatase [bacterium]|nr:serine/threonine-protein phosphatase [bacterium]